MHAADIEIRTVQGGETGGKVWHGATVLADWLRELGSPYEFRGGRVNGCFGGARDPVMRRVVVRCVVLCCVVLQCVVVGCGVVCCIALYYNGFWCIVSGGAVVCCAVLGCVKLRCVAL